MNLFNLFATLTLDTSDYDKGLKSASKGASSFASGFGSAMKVGAKAVTALITTVVAATTAIAALVSQSITYGDEIDKESQKLSLSTDEYQKWSYILQLCGTDVSTLTTAVRNLTTFTEELTEGDADNLLALQELGIGYEDFVNMSYDEKLETIIEALQDMEDETERNTLAQDIFGRSYQELLPLLNQSSDYIDTVTASMEDLGLIMSEDVVSASASLNDQFTTLKLSAKTWGYTLLSDLYPYISLIVEGLQGLISGSNDAMEALTDGLVGLIDEVATALPTILDTAADLLIEVLEGIVEILPEITPDIVNMLVSVLEKIIAVLPSLAGSLGDVLVALFDALLKLDWATLIIDLLEALLDIILVKLPTMFTDLLFLLLDTIFNLFFTAEGLSKIGKFGIMLAQAIVNGLISGIESGTNLMIRAVNSLLAGISKIWTWTGLAALPTISEISIPRVSWYAEGGMFDDLQKGTAFAVAGEAGAEVVAQGRNGTGVLNVEQFTEAMVAALDEYGVADIIGNAAVAVVNGVLSGNKTGTGANSQNTEITVKIGDTAFKGYLVKAVNDTLNSRGRKSLNKVTAY